jgi:hypothetical protein
MLRESGDEAAAQQIAKVVPWYPHYATITLGHLPDGQGVPSLVSMAQGLNNPNNTANRLALHMLAQLASEHPDARESLLDKARRDEIPEELWPSVAQVVAGNEQLQLDPPDPTDARAGGNVATRTVTGRHSQTIYRVDRANVLSPDEFNRRAELLDLLIDTTSETANTVALQALLDASSSLSLLAE